MNSISTALEHLRSQLTQALPTAPGLHHFDVSFPLNDAFDPLAWLGVQHCYPQFYWQQRNGDEELAALGAVNGSRNVSWPKISLRSAFSPSFFSQSADND